MKTERERNLSTSSSLRFERCHVDRETVLHIGLEQSLISFIDFLDRNHFHISSDVMLAAKIEHLLRFGDTADHRAGNTVAPNNEVKWSEAQRLRGRAVHA